MAVLTAKPMRHKDMSDYSLEEHLIIKHVMSDITGVADKDWYRTIFTMR